MGTDAHEGKLYTIHDVQLYVQDLVRVWDSKREVERHQNYSSAVSLHHTGLEICSHRIKAEERTRMGLDSLGGGIGHPRCVQFVCSQVFNVKVSASC